MTVTASRGIDNHISERRAALRKRVLNSRGRVSREQRTQLADVVEADELEIWQSDGFRNLAEWVAARYSVSEWMARRLVNTARVLPSLPSTEAAFEAGHLNLDQVVELCRFAIPDTEQALVKWARRVKAKAIRHRADVELKKSLQETVEVDRSRFLHHWWMTDGRLGLEGAFPPDEGAVIAKALDRAASRLPDILEEDHEDSAPPDVSLDIRRADALFALASARLADDQDTDRATIVVHADLETLSNGGRGCEIENGPAIHVETARRLSCDGRIELVLHNDLGDVVGVARRYREPPPWMLRQLRHRDRGCTFPGCDLKRFLHAHHIRHWTRGGPTYLDNLTLVCTFHHKLVHEYGWGVELGPDRISRWFRPGGMPYEPGRAPPKQETLEAA